MICEKTIASTKTPHWLPRMAEPLSLLRHEAGSKPQSLRFSPTAWAKLLYFRDAGQSEVGGFGIAPADDLLYVEDVQLVRQVCDVASVSFDDHAVADFFDRQVDAGRRPAQFGRIWGHCHPGACPQPSLTDEGTFARAFGPSDWAVMFILARDGQTYARLEFHIGPGGAVLLPVEVDYRRPFPGSSQAAWHEEYLTNVDVHEWPLAVQGSPRLEPIAGELRPSMHQVDWFDPWEDFWAKELGDVGTQSPARRTDDNDF